MTNNTQEEKHELLTRDWGFLRIINYRGCLIKKIYLGYVVFGRHTVGSPEEVDRIIDESLQTVNKSIKQ